MEYQPVSQLASIVLTYLLYFTSLHFTFQTTLMPIDR